MPEIRQLAAIDAAEEGYGNYWVKCYIYEIGYLRGRVLENEGKLEDALKMYTKSLSYYPTHYELREAIGRTQRLLGNHSQSIQIFEDLLKSLPLSASRNLELAKSYFVDGNRKKALEHLEIALNVWGNADATYKPAIEAREKWSQWNEAN